MHCLILLHHIAQVVMSGVNFAAFVGQPNNFPQSDSAPPSLSSTLRNDHPRREKLVRDQLDIKPSITIGPPPLNVACDPRLDVLVDRFSETQLIQKHRVEFYVILRSCQITLNRIFWPCLEVKKSVHVVVIDQPEKRNIAHEPSSKATNKANLDLSIVFVVHVQGNKWKYLSL